MKLIVTKAELISVAAWSDIIIDKDNVFAWKDTSDNVKLKPKKDNTFILFAQNWMSIWYRTPKNVLAWTVDINWIFQVSTELKGCGVNIAGAVQYLPLITWDIVKEMEYDLSMRTILMLLLLWWNRMGIYDSFWFM